MEVLFMNELLVIVDMVKGFVNERPLADNKISKITPKIIEQIKYFYLIVYRLFPSEIVILQMMNLKFTLPTALKELLKVN